MRIERPGLPAGPPAPECPAPCPDRGAARRRRVTPEARRRRAPRRGGPYRSPPTRRFLPGACARGSSRDPGAAPAGTAFPCECGRGIPAAHRRAQQLGGTLQEVERERDVALDHVPHPELVAHREVDPDLVEQRARRPREVAAVGAEPPDGVLTGQQYGLAVATPRRILLVLDDPRRQFPIDRSAEAVHIRSYPPCFVPLALSCGSLPLGFPRSHRRSLHPGTKMQGSTVKAGLTDRWTISHSVEGEVRRPSGQAQDSPRMAPPGSMTRWTPSNSGRGSGWSERRCGPVTRAARGPPWTISAARA